MKNIIWPFSMFAEKYPEMDKLATKLGRETIWPKDVFVKEIQSWLDSSIEEWEIEELMTRLVEKACRKILLFSRPHILF